MKNNILKYAKDLMKRLLYLNVNGIGIRSRHLSALQKLIDSYENQELEEK